MSTYARAGKASFSFILVTVFLDAVGLGLVFPILPSLLGEFIAPGPDATRAYGLFMAVYAAMQFFASPVLGALSDRFGRRPILLFSLVGAGLDYVLMALAPNLALLFVGRIISGLTGASMTVASAYVSDTSDDSNRASRFGLINAAFGVGFVVGPALGGFLGDISTRAPFVAAACMNLANFAFGALVLRESLLPANRRNVEIKRLNPLRSLKWALSEPLVKGPVIVMFLLFLAGHIPGTIWAIYTGQRYAWDMKTIGLSFSAYGALMAIAQGGLTGLVTRFLGSRAVVILLTMEAMCYFMIGAATEGWMIFAILFPLCLASIAGPTLQSQATASVPADMQGELQGTIMAIVAPTAIVTPLVATNTHALFNSPEWLERFHLPGAAFYLGGVGCLGAVAAYVYLFRKATGFTTPQARPLP